MIIKFIVCVFVIFTFIGLVRLEKRVSILEMKMEMTASTLGSFHP